MDLFHAARPSSVTGSAKRMQLDMALDETFPDLIQRQQVSVIVDLLLTSKNGRKKMAILAAIFLIPLLILRMFLEKPLSLESGPLIYYVLTFVLIIAIAFFVIQLSLVRTAEKIETYDPLLVEKVKEAITQCS